VAPGFMSNASLGLRFVVSALAMSIRQSPDDVGRAEQLSAVG
jgi:hypothetical protein